MLERNPHRTIVTTLANRNISLSNKKKMDVRIYQNTLEYY